MGDRMEDAGLERVRREEFPSIGESVYMNAASLSPLPERARHAVDGYNARRGRVHELKDADFVAPLEGVRERAARLIGARSAEIAVCPNTSFGINAAALGLPVKSGGIVVASDREFPANVYPWMHREHLKLELVPADPLGRPDEERLMERIARRDVSIFALSAVQFTNGHLADLEAFGRLCRDTETIFVVDAIQALGQVPVNVEAHSIDVLATGAHKWLCGPLGTGFLYVRREVQERMTPAMVGWSSMKASADLSHLLDYGWGFLDDARRYELATPAFQDYAGLAESLALLLEVGIDRIQEHVDAILEPLRHWIAGEADVVELSSPLKGKRSGIVAFRHPDMEGARDALRDGGVVCAVREDAIRISPHLYNTREEVEEVVAILERHAGRVRR
jgi:cysteine desulfurase / selenocysteine lyase